MAELFSKCVILHSPAEIYLKGGMGELFPLLVRALDQSQIVAMQFLRVGCVRVTVRSQAYREELLKPQLSCLLSLSSPCSPFLVRCIVSSSCITKSSPPSALAPALF